MIMEDVFRDYGQFENIENKKIICFNITKTYLLSERENLYECTKKILEAKR